MLKARIREEEDILMGLVQRRAQLLQENEALEARAGSERPLPTVPAEMIDGDIDEAGSVEQVAEEDLIDMAVDERGPPHASESSRAGVNANTEDSVPGVRVTPATPTEST